MERGAYVAGASIIYVLYDYVLYDRTMQAGEPREIFFRVSQLALLGTLTYILVDKFGWRTGAAFGALYFSWCFDAGYYALYGHNAWRDEVESGTVTWAQHTPAGWFENPTSARTLKLQMGLGISLSIALLI